MASSRNPPLHTCVNRRGEIVCFDDLCHGTSRTLCGLEQGIDFDFDDDDEAQADADDEMAYFDGAEGDAWHEPI